MTIRTTGLAAMLATTLAATPAPAQEVSSGPVGASPDEVADMVTQLLQQLQPFAEEHGVQGFDEEIRAVFEARLPGAMVAASEDRAADPDYHWGSGWRFDSGYDVPVDGVLAPNPERQIYADALACSRANGDREVAHFRRIREGVLRGHICAVSHQDGDRAVLTTLSLFEGGGRRGWTSFETIARVEGDPQAALDLLEPAIEGNVALAEAFDAVAMRSLPLAAPNRPAGGGDRP